MSLSQIRYQQQYRQLESANQAVSTVVSYGTRDPATGLRVMETADGGLQMAQYLSNTAPSGVLAISRNSTIGLAGYASQKPH